MEIQHAGKVVTEGNILTLSQKNLIKIVAWTLIIVSNYLFVTLIIVQILNLEIYSPFSEQILIGPAYFLSRSFLWFAFLVPLLCGFCAYVLLKDNVRAEIFYVLPFTGLILVVLSSLSHLLVGTPTELNIFLVNAFGLLPTIILLSLFLIFQTLIVLMILNKKEKKGEEDLLGFALPDNFDNEVYPNEEETIHNDNFIDEQQSRGENELVIHPTDDMNPETSSGFDIVKNKNSYMSRQLSTDSDYLKNNELNENDFKKNINTITDSNASEELVDNDLEDENKDDLLMGNHDYSVSTGILSEYESSIPSDLDNETQTAATVLMNTLAEFKVDARVTGVRRGPVITMFELLPAPGVKISRIVNLSDNIALRLAASRVRIVAPIPGKHAVGIEVPNKKRTVVSFREIVIQEDFIVDPLGTPDGIPIALGKDIAGGVKVIDLSATPHLLIAGATGSGKSVLVNSIICSILFSRTPDQVRLLLIDPKIVELKFYNHIPHLLTPVITEPRRAHQALQYCLCEMERRYSLLDAVGVRDIKSFNRKIKLETKKLTIESLPYIVIVIDEFADLMATTGKELENTIARLAAMSRAVGIHLVLATQRPSIDVITGLIKANIPSRIAFMVSSKFDSRIIIDSIGAEKLLGGGDMLYSSASDANPVRIQGAFLSDEEVEKIAAEVRELGKPDYVDEDIMFETEEEQLLGVGEEDSLQEEALKIVMMAGKASASYLQRRLKIGYNRAARIVEDMESRGIVGPANGSKPREILVVPDRT